VISQEVKCSKCSWSKTVTPALKEGMSHQDEMIAVGNSKAWSKSLLYRHMKEKHSGSPDPL
jgi:hypothetical protein